MAAGTTAIDTALETTGDADGTDLITFELGTATPEPTEGALDYIADHEELAARKLAPPFWGKPFVAALLASFTREIQSLEDTVWTFLDLRTLPLADLPRLKVLGKIVGQSRHGFDTEAYRTMIEARALANVSRGRASDILAVLEVVFGPGEYALVEMGNAVLYVTALGSVDAQGLSMAAEILPNVRAAGVGMQFLFTAELADVALWGSALWGSALWASTRIV
jgi:hypothetical protein